MAFLPQQRVARGRHQLLTDVGLNALIHRRNQVIAVRFGFNIQLKTGI